MKFLKIKNGKEYILNALPEQVEEFLAKGYKALPEGKTVEEKFHEAVEPKPAPKKKVAKKK